MEAPLQYAAHDLKNLIAAIRGNVELAMRLKTDEKHDTFLRNALRASDHASELLASLPEMLHGTERRLEKVDLREMIHEIAAFTITARGVEWSATLPSGSWMIAGVKKDLARALTNLLVNACEATDCDKDEQATIRIHCEQVAERTDEESAPQPFACITVTDNGVGISETRLNQLFKGETSKGRIGSGLGLLSTLNIVAEHGGFMEITSELGHGTSFKIFLPLS